MIERAPTKHSEKFAERTVFHILVDLLLIGFMIFSKSTNSSFFKRRNGEIFVDLLRWDIRIGKLLVIHNKPRQVFGHFFPSKQQQKRDKLRGNGPWRCRGVDKEMVVCGS